VSVVAGTIAAYEVTSDTPIDVDVLGGTRPSPTAKWCIRLVREQRRDAEMFSRGNDNDTRQGHHPRRQTAEGEKMTQTMSAPRLSATDRCDRCGAQAYVQVRLSGGGELLFCAHHGRKHHAALTPLTVEWHDESHRLDEPEPGRLPEDS
jgi:hypothetical protein